MTTEQLKADIALLAQFEARALSKGLFAAFGAYRRQRNELEEIMSARDAERRAAREIYFEVR
jgi:hypothetical protein